MEPLASFSFPPVQPLFGLLSPHGLGSALGFLAGASLLLREVRRRGDLDEQVVVRALTWGAVGSIVGARLDYVVSHPGRWDSVWEMLKAWEGGLAMFGGFIGGVLFALPVLVKARVHLPRFLDAAAPGFAIGVVIGRIGDVLIWDHLGDVAQGWSKAIGFTIRTGYELAPGFEPAPARALPGDLTCVEALDQGQFFAGCTYHQPALYDLIGALALLGVLLLIRRRGRARAGVSICVWGLWYGTQRFAIDFLRSIDERGPFGLTGTQLLAVVLAVACAVLLVRIARSGDPLPSREGSLLRDDVVPPPDQDSSDSAASSAPSA